jgi:hypothetical protein
MNRYDRRELNAADRKRLMNLLELGSRIEQSLASNEYSNTQTSMIQDPGSKSQKAILVHSRHEDLPSMLQHRRYRLHIEFHNGPEQSLCYLGPCRVMEA